jgi:DNA polymerase I
MTKKKETILLLDANALLHRAWHAIPPLTTKDGRVVNAAYGFTMIMEKMIEQYKPDSMVVAWDRKEKTFRHDEFADYKGHRPEREQELYDQIPIIKSILEVFDIPSLDARGYEADDIVGTLAHRAEQEGMNVLILTGDLDSLQLVTDNIKVITFKKGISQSKEYDVQAVIDRYGLTPEEFIDYKALRGDPSDNIPGIAGIGEKSATVLIQEFKSVEGVYKALEEEKVLPKFAKKLEGNKQLALDSKFLVTILKDMPLKFSFSDATMSEPDREKLVEMYRDLEFRTLLRKYVEAPPFEGMDEKKEKKKESKSAGKAEKITDLSRLEELSVEAVSVLVASQQADLFGATIAAVGLSDGKKAFVIANPTSDQLEITGLYLQKAKQLITHDLKGLLHTTGWELCSRVFDVKIGSYLLHSGSKAHDLNSILHKELSEKVPELPKAFATEKDYQNFGKNVSFLQKGASAIKEQIKEMEMESVFEEIEMPLVCILHQMEETGIEVDTKALDQLSKKLNKRLETLTKKIIDLAGQEFNLNSPSQLAEILFDKLELPTKGIKKTKKGFSTAAAELEKLWDEHEIIPLMSEYRELAKLQSTYADALPKLVEKDGRIHSSFNQVVTATGRLSSSEPNLQNIPIRTELGNEIRKAFVAPRGKRLIAADYSQIELRLVAVLAGDKAFIEAFNDGADIHTRTAAEVWEVEEAEVTSEQRRGAKAINFGIIYGMGPHALAKSTGTSFYEAKQFIEKYFTIHKAVREYLDNTIKLAHKQGYVESLFGRRRYLPELETGMHQLVAAAERMAINMPVQGTASDIMKKAMVAVDGWLKKSEWPARIVSQVHDELVIEVEKGAVDQVAKGVKEMMEGVAEFAVPLKVDVEVGKNWGEMERWEK